MNRLPTDPDPDAAMHRHPRWTFERDGDGDGWVARERNGLATLRGKSLESVEGKVVRAENTWCAVGGVAQRVAS